MHYTELIQKAKAAEKADNIKEAITLYEKAIKQKPLLEEPYTRLMIAYRKLKRPDDELRTIKTAIDLFTQHHDERVKQFSGKDKIGQVSKALLKSLTGSPKTHKLNYPEPIPKWITRQKQVEKKIYKHT